MELIQAWRTFSPDAAPLILPGDEAILEASGHVRISSIPEFLAHPEFDFLRSPVFHLGLHPLPFAGDLSTADIFILLQNPGFHPSDYFAEFTDSAFLAAKIGTVRQEFPNQSYPFPSLNPRFSNHAGYDYWRRKLRGVLAWVIQSRSVSLAEALQLLSQRIAILELVPYHSAVAGFRESTIRRLRSVRLIQEYVHQQLVPKANAGHAAIIVTRQGKAWNLTDSENVIVYSGQEARSAHLSLRSRGGMKIQERLRNDLPAS